jgi:hypothetical protein
MSNTKSRKSARKKYISGATLPSHEATNRMRGMIGADESKLLDVITGGAAPSADDCWQEGSRKIESGCGMLPLVVERIGEVTVFGHRLNAFSLAQYGEQNGDLMRDPEVCVARLSCGSWICFYFRNDYCHYEQSEQYSIGGSAGLDPAVVDRVCALCAFASSYLADIRSTHAEGIVALSEAAGLRSV